MDGAVYMGALELTKLPNGYVNIAGTVVVDGCTHTVDYDAPQFMVDALMSAAVNEGALT